VKLTNDELEVPDSIPSMDARISPRHFIENGSVAQRRG
jgi:hypothetical protein